MSSAGGGGGRSKLLLLQLLALLSPPFRAPRRALFSGGAGLVFHGGVDEKDES